MAWLPVQNKDQHSIGGTTSTIALTSNTTTGNTLIVVALPSAAVTISSIAISAGSATFTKSVSLANGTLPAEIWCASNITGGTTPTITITWSGSTGSASDCVVYEFSGGAATTTLDGTATGSGTGTAIATSSITTTNPGTLLIGGVNCGGTTTAGEAAWTAKAPTTDGDLSQYRITTATGSYSSTGTQTPSAAWTAVLAAFKPAALQASVLVAPRSTLTGTAKSIHNAVLLCAPHTTVVATATILRRAAIGLARSASLSAQGAVVSATFSAILGIAGRIVGTPRTIYFGKVGILAGRAPVISARLFPGVILTLGARVNYKGVDPLAPGISLVNTAKIIRNLFSLIQPTGRMLASPVRVTSTASVAIGSKASLSGVAAARHPGSATLAPRSSVAAPTKVNHFDTCQILRPVTIVANGIPTTAGPGRVTVVLGRTVSSTAKNLAQAIVALISSGRMVAGNYTNQSASVLILIGPIGKIVVGTIPATISTRASLLLVGNIIKSGGSISICSIRTTMGNRFAAFVTHNAILQLLAGMGTGTRSQVRGFSTVSAIGNKISGSSKAFLSIGLNTNPLAKTIIGGIATLVPQGSVIYRIVTALAPRSTVSANGVQSANQVRIATRTTMAAGNLIGWNAVVPLLAQIGVSANSILATTGPGKSGISSRTTLLANLLRRARTSSVLTVGGQVSVRGSVIYSMRDTIQSAFVMSATALRNQSPTITSLRWLFFTLARGGIVQSASVAIVSRSSVGVSSSQARVGICVLATTGAIRAIPSGATISRATIVLGRTVTGTAKSLHYAAMILRSVAAAGGTLTAGRFSAVIIRPALSVLVRAFNASTPFTSQINSRGGVTAVAFVRHSSALHIFARSTLTPFNTIIRYATVRSGGGSTILSMSRTVYNSLGSLGGGVLLSLGIDYKFPAVAQITMRSSLLSIGSAIDNARSPVTAAGTTGAAGQMQAYAESDIHAALIVLGNTLRGLRLSATISTRSSIDLESIAHFFGGASSRVSSTAPKGTVSNLNPRSTIRQTS
jgi:hypothetical protein